MIEKIQHIDPSKIKDLNELQKVLVLCMNIIESQSSTIEAQAKEIQELKDEINRMKGEHGSPTPKPKVSHATGQKPKIKPKRKPHNKGSKKANLEVDNVVDCPIDKSLLPADAVFKGYSRVIQQDIIFKRNNTLFKVPIYYSKQEGKTYRGTLPPEYEGQFGNELKAWLQTFHHLGDMTQGRLEILLKNIGIQISDGTISNILLSNTEQMKAESIAILKSGLEHIEFAQMDCTKSYEAGQTKATQIICTPYYSFYQTMDNKSRCSVIGALQGKMPSDIPLLYDNKAVELLHASVVPKKDQRLLAQLLQLNRTYILSDFEAYLAKKAPHLLNKDSYPKVLSILALNYYQVQEDFPIVKILLTDAGHEYAAIALIQLLCWIHEERHYKKMVPKLTLHQNLLEQVRCQIWEYYKKLLNFKTCPDPSGELSLEDQNLKRATLRQEFETIFTQTTAYEALNKRLAQTYSRKEKLLGVLDFPKVPLHNNAAEIAVRRKARKRDISLHTMSVKGTIAQDAFMSVVETAAKLGVNAFDYLLDRLTKKNQMTPLAHLIPLHCH